LLITYLRYIKWRGKCGWEEDNAMQIALVAQALLGRGETMA